MPYERRRDAESPVLKDPLWRYMDFTKFVAMLANESLHFTRVDQLGDSFEGSFPDLQKGACRGFSGDEDRRRYNDGKRKIREDRKCYYVNCWHGNDNESDAMWKIYVPNNKGVAIPYYI